jgi:hypothetical protein
MRDFHVEDPFAASAPRFESDGSTYGQNEAFPSRFATVRTDISPNERFSLLIDLAIVVQDASNASKSFSR